MADFMTNLWESVFTPGATPTLLIATNVTFGALQVVLAGLLLATYSIHFVILSFLCGGLWYSINWFAHELQQAQAKEVEAERLRKKRHGETEWRTKGEVADSADDEGEDTEVEGGLKESTSWIGTRSTMEDGEEENMRERNSSAVKTYSSQRKKGTSSGLQTTADPRNTRLRKGEESDRSGELSTDSEWEKLDD